MQGVTYTKRDAQEAVLKLMLGNVVLVGHALHHDLHALQLDPTAVIDTALLCSYKCATFLSHSHQSVASEVTSTCILPTDWRRHVVLHVLLRPSCWASARNRHRGSMSCEMLAMQTKERKSMLSGIMTGASVPKSSPRL